MPPDAHNYDSARSVSEYHAAGVVIAKNDSEITLELRNEIKVGDEITFVIPHESRGAPVQVRQIINARDNSILPKMSAGQHNAIKIPRDWVNANDFDKLVPLVLAYKHK